MILYRFEFCIIATCYFPILSWSVRMTCRVIHVVRGPLPLLSVVSSLETALRLKSLHTEQRPPPPWAQLVPSLLHLTPRGPATLLECVWVRSRVSILLLYSQGPTQGLAALTDWMRPINIPRSQLGPVWRASDLASGLRLSTAACPSHLFS